MEPAAWGVVLPAQEGGLMTGRDCTVKPVTLSSKPEQTCTGNIYAQNDNAQTNGPPAGQRWKHPVGRYNFPTSLRGPGSVSLTPPILGLRIRLPQLPCNELRQLSFDDAFKSDPTLRAVITIPFPFITTLSRRWQTWPT